MIRILLSLILVAGCAAPVQTTLTATRSTTQAQMAALSTERLSAKAPDEPGDIEGMLAKPPAEDLGNFGKVEPTLFRGARPTEKGIAKLKEMGVKVIINLENKESVVRQEEIWARKYGIQFYSLPLSVITPPSEARVNRFLELASNPANRPLYFHCMQGRDRTGCMAFSYRITQHGWNYDAAYNEMVQYKFHTYLLGLRYFLKKFAHEHEKAS